MSVDADIQCNQLQLVELHKRSDSVASGHLNQAHMPVTNTQHAMPLTEVVNSLTPTRELACGGKQKWEDLTELLESDSETERTAAARD